MSCSFNRNATPFAPGVFWGLLFLTAWLAAWPARVAAVGVADFSVQVSAAVQVSPPQITLVWPADVDSTNYTLFRKSRDATSWGAATNLAPNATSYVDSNVVVGTSYEYKIVKKAYEVSSSFGYTGYGYILAGIQTPLVEERGKVLLLVDNTMTNSLAAEISRLQFDLMGDGWTVIRRDVSRTTNVTAIKAVITNEYAADPVNLKSVFILGHVPVPYSGSIAPDGHGNHVGAWSADCYYADMDGTWTDTTVTSTNSSRTENWNVPGDGKFDQSTPPSPFELQVGRVDLWNMPTFPKSETELLRQYLNREHDFRMRYLNPRRRGLVDDHFGTFGSEAFAANGYRNFAPFFGNTNITAGPWFSTLASNSYLWGHACGGGSYTSESGVGVTADFVSTNTQVMFTMHFGSYFGDYDSQNNLMRAQLANAAGGLSCAWAGRPHWFFHQMAMGETLGYSAIMTENYGGSTYSPGYREIHVNVLGDPTLRMDAVAPPAALKIVDNAGTRDLRWLPSPDTVLGYFVYGAASVDGPFTKLGGTLFTTTNFTDSSSGSEVYMVRAIKLESSASGTYTNASQGIFENVAGTLSPPTITFSQPTNSSYFPLGTAIPFAVNTADANNDIVQVDYLTNGVVFATVTNWPYAWTWTNAWVGTYPVSAVVRDAVGLSATSAVVNVTVTFAISSLVPTGSAWKYNDIGTDLGTAWRAADYDDSAWPSGPAQLGFGDGDERTLVDSNRTRITTYFRKAFVPPPNGMYLGVTARLLRDDGGVVYLNGVEVFRSNMPTNQTILWGTQASAVALTPDESIQYYNSSVNLSLLHAGTNVLAVEIHQNGTNSSDLTFDFELIATNLPAASNTAPSISSFASVVIDEDTPTASIPLAVSDRESWPEGLTLSATSSVPALVGSNGFVFTGTGSNRWLVISPAINQTGSATVTVTVSDGLLSTSTNFMLTVNPTADPPYIAWSNISNGALLSPGTVPLAVSVNDPDGNLSYVQYFVDGTYVGQSSVTPYGFSWTGAAMGYHRLEARAYDSTGLSGVTSNIFVSVLGAPATVVNTGSIWKYWDRGSQPIGSWTAPAYDDSAWPAGPSPLGYGDANGTTFPATTNSYGTNSSNRYITTYYRSAFVVSNAASLTNFVVNVQRDDGLLLYLNGTEIYRLNLPTGAVSYATLSTMTVSGADEVAWYSNTVNALLVQPGTNVFAAEIHQVTTNSTDIFFNLKMTAQPTVQPPALAIGNGQSQLQFSWPSWSAGLSLMSATNLGPDAAWSPVTNGFTITNGQVRIDIPNDDAGGRFFRLRGN